MKQALLIRQDLKLPKGKLATQCCHASLEAALKSPPQVLKKWRQQGAKKVILKVKNKKELLFYKEKAKKARLVTVLIIDAAKTFFKKPTLTCLAIGPDDDEKLDKIVGKLKLL